MNGQNNALLEVGTKIDIHNNGVLGESKIERFYLDVGRIVGNFQFCIVSMGTLGIFSVGGLAG